VIADQRISTRISSGELERRWTATRSEMAERGVQALIMQATNDWLGGAVKYFTDIPANNGYPRTVIFHADAHMTIVEMGAFGAGRVFEGSDDVHRGVGEILHTPSFPSIDYTAAYDAELVAAALVNPGGLLAGFSTHLRAALPGVEWSDASPWVEAIKAIKSDEELGLIRRTAALQDAVFSRVAAAIRPGLRDIDVTALAQHEAQKLGSEQGIYLGASARIGVRSPFMGRHFQGRVLGAGDHLSLLIEVNGPGGFYTEIARTLVLGKASQQLREAFENVREAQQHTLSLLKPGTPCRAIASAHDTWMKARGLPPETRLYAHGQGYDMVERPLIRRDDDMKIAEGMNLAVHPGYETPEFFAVICDNYIIGPDGPGACLHRTEKKLFEI
jgi:Xaa-Pro aminopeptidase